MDFITLSQLIDSSEFDYQILKEVLKGYKAIRRKINHLLKKRYIIRIKKGLYILNPDYSRLPYSREILANLIYGPSYISLQYALSFYQLTPERVETITSVTFKKDKSFNTPIGRFTYRKNNIKHYPLGVLRTRIEGNRYVLMASIEKALIDLIDLEFKDLNGNIESIPELLFSNLRIDEEELWRKINLNRLEKIAGEYKSKRIQLLKSYLKLGKING